MKRQAKIEIQNALVDLMAEYPFQEISTKMICAYCNINRSTFYDYYKDKFDLLDTINSKHKEKFQFLLSALHHNFENIKQDKLKLYKFFIIIAKYIKHNEQFFQRHFSYLSNENIIHRLYKFSERLLSTNYE